MLSIEKIEERLECIRSHKLGLAESVYSKLASHSFDIKDIYADVENIMYWNGVASAYEDVLDQNPRRDLMIMNWKEQRSKV